MICNFLYVASLGMILPNATAGGLSRHGANTGAASALVGSIQYLIGAIASSLVSYFNNGKSLPMTALIGCCGLAAFSLSIFCTMKKMNYR